MTRSVLVTDYAWPNLEVERRILDGIGVEIVAAETGDEDELTELASDVVAILTNWKPVSGRVLRNAGRCLTVARYGVGLDNIDVATATELGIVVSNVPDYCVDEVSDHALALVLLSLIHIFVREYRVVGPTRRARRWPGLADPKRVL